MVKKRCTDVNPSAALDFMKAGKCVSLTVLTNVSMVAVLLQTPVSVSLAGEDPTAPVHVTLTTGDLTAAAVASAKTEPYATPSLEHATVPRGSKAGAARSAVTKGRMEMTAIKNASVKMEPPVTM